MHNLDIHSISGIYRTPCTDIITGMSFRSVKHYVRMIYETGVRWKQPPQMKYGKNTP